MTDWHAEVDVPTTGAPTEDELVQVMRAIPSYATVTHDGDAGRLTVGYGVEASTLRQATERAIREVREATGLPPNGVRVITDERLRHEVEHPPRLELVGMVEAGKILNVSRQRVYELERDREDFPRPVVELAAGKVFTRASIEAFNERWVRRAGRPPKPTE